MKHRSIIKLILVSFLCAFMMASCTKEGPMGPAGKDGIDGVDGTNGADGADGNATCSECHSDNQVIFARENQWAASTHAIGTAFERNEGECATCHTSQGFLANLAGTYDIENGIIENPNPQNCYTCHNIHETYTADDLALTVSGAIALRNTSATHDFGKGSVCASCHQGRTVEPFPVAGGDSITVSGTRYGVHHGPQANVIAGVGMGLFEVGDGFASSTNSAHASLTDACVTCHMASPFGTQAGGHTMSMTYVYHGADAIWAEGCVDCHTADEAHALVEECQTEVKALLVELKALLDATGATKAGSDSSVSGTYTAEVAGALLNYKALTEDGSYGVHNPKYVKKLLQNNIASLQ